MLRRVFSGNRGAPANTMPIAYFKTKDFDKSLNAAIQGGGRGQKIAIRVRAIVGSVEDPDPFRGIPVTNHGESRIPNCVKYDVGDGWRLVTQQTNHTCFFLFVGDHGDVDRWLDGHQGQRFGIKDGKTVLLPGIGDEIGRSGRYHADHHDKPLAEWLDVDAIDHVLEGLPRSIARGLKALDGRSNSSKLEEIVRQISDSKRAR